MRALLVVLALLAPPSAALTATPPAPAGQPGRATLVVRNASPASVAVTAVSAAGTVRGTAHRVARGRYAVHLVFRAPGTWRLTARFAGRAFPLGTVAVRAPEYLLNRPATMIAYADGTLLLAEGGERRVVRIDPATGAMTLVADGFENPFGLVRLPDGDLVVSSLQSVLRHDRATGRRETIATLPAGVEGGPLAFDGSRFVYMAATDHRIHRIDLSSGAMTAIAGNGTSGDTGDGGPALAATMTVPHGLLVDVDGSLLIADTDNHKIRRVDLQTGVITTFARDVQSVAMIVRTPDGALVASEFRSGNLVRIAADGTRAVAARGLGVPWSLAVAGGTLYVVDGGTLTLNRVLPDGRVARVRLTAPS